MSQPKHTPGPWSLEETYGPSSVSKFGSSCVAFIHGPKARNIADICDSADLRLEEAEANARLIASAPELLNAVKHLRSCLDFSRKMLTGEIRKNPSDISALEDRVKQYESLIAKAERAA